MSETERREVPYEIVLKDGCDGHVPPATFPPVEQ